METRLAVLERLLQTGYALVLKLLQMHLVLHHGCPECFALYDALHVRC